MEPWQRIGTYAAGLALDAAGSRATPSCSARTDMIVAAGGGERDMAVDGAILTGLDKAADPEAFLNERLMSDLRPTLFLAQLSNLLAGNISIVHGVTGSSRTFMGEEAAGVDAVRIALARIQAGQSDIALVGGSQHCERKDMLLLYEFGAPTCATNSRRSGSAAPQGGFALGSLGASWCSKRAATPRRAAQSRWRGSPPCSSDRAKPQARRASGDARADVGHDRAAVAQGRERDHLRRDRRRAGDRRGARIPGGASRRSGARHRHRYRPRRRAAVSR